MTKQLLLSISFLFLSLSIYSQAPNSFKYQAIIRNANNTILTNQTIGLKFTILKGGIEGTPIYSETFTETTNLYGLITIEIGTGTSTDDFSTISWGNNTYFLETAIDVNGGATYETMGTSQLVSVPYALYASQAKTVENDQVNDADADPTNELQEWATLPNIPADFADNTDDVDDADADPTNEIQNISLSGTTLSISDGASIDLSSIDTNTQLDETAVDNFVANNGYLTSVPSTTRSIIITPGKIIPERLYGSSKLSYIGGWAHPCVTFPDNVTSGFTVSFPSPADWDGSKMSVKILYTSNGTSGNFQFSVASRGVLVGQSIAQGPGGGGIVLPAVSGANILAESSLTNFGIQPTGFSVMNIMVRRLGANENDTSTEDLKVVGLVVNYQTN